MLFVILLISFVFVSVFALVPEAAQEKVIVWAKDTAKWALVCALVVAVFLAMFILLPPAHAEEEEFYQIVAVIRTVEEGEEVYFRGELLTDTVVEVDDLDNLWEYFENSKNVEFDSDKEQNDMALCFIADNGILAETLREEPLVEGRIVVIQMWTCGTDAIEDDEILGVYYTEFIAL